jgi:glycosyltransferase involved in cell wall biosynthesis
LYVSAIARDLARRHPVSVLCGRPTYSARGIPVSRVERWHEVDIRRCVATAFDKNRLAGRVVNTLTLLLSIGVRALREFSPHDLALVVTNPPALPYVVAVACRIRGCRYVVIVHDRYPDALVAVTTLSETSLIVTAGRWLERRLLQGAVAVVTVGRDMRESVVGRYPSVADRTAMIPNWGEIDRVRPGDRSVNSLLRSLGLTNRFVVLYAGNLGRPNDIDTIVEAARRLRGETDCHFLFVGDGAKVGRLEAAVRSGHLDNVTILGPLPRDQQSIFLNACDLGIVTLVPGMKGVAVPSRLYNLLAAGRPILALADSGSEIDLVVREENVGWVSPPGDVDRCVGAIRDAASDRPRLAQMAVRARAVAERRFSEEIGLAAYRDLVESVPGFGAGA